MFLQWSSEYSIGVDAIDNQHKELFDRANKLFEAMKSGKGKDQTIQILNYVEEYVKIHFAAEEEYMRKINYPGLALQREKHKEFREEIEKLKDTFDKDGINISLVLNTQKKIYDWLNNHILVLDKQIGK